ncbi:hypothetical protein BDP55DRAFT_630260 [Colletotrichum godetiae]|uniref:Uncharacterized protein n=1 Tax=Colletotrichum godetiae TaxID=1209918 RepID=A0AAJ0ANS3_9PEZI|nr:uncharacterized protein BDP55DRAFT_630260 [Colletotrichum godetiae]KAK1687600.1 hypothetical protein BDP55DRAFT_630260 [Colletotrichum godetiae]
MRVSEPIAQEPAAVDAQPVGAALSASPLSSSLVQWMREARSENRQGRHVIRKGSFGCTMCSPLKGLTSPLDFVSSLPFLVITMASPIKEGRRGRVHLPPHVGRFPSTTFWAHNGVSPVPQSNGHYVPFRSAYGSAIHPLPSYATFPASFGASSATDQ